MATLGQYEVLSELGRGGMGVVYRGRAPDGRDVAIKMLLRPTPESRARFERERRLLGSVSETDGFVPLLDGGEVREGPYLVMPFFGGGSLRDRLREGPLEIDDAIRIVRDMAVATGRAHAQGLVHRDLKPENVLFASKHDGEPPLIADLGLAKHFSKDSPGASKSVSLSVDGQFKGTAGYMAPEQIDAAKEAGPRADVFALGAILFECLAGGPAFDGDNIHAVLAKVSSGSFPSVRRLRPETPRWLAAVIARALKRDPAARFADGTELARAIDEGPARAARAQLVAIVGAALGVAAAFGATWVIARATSPSASETHAPSPPPSPSPEPARTPTPAPRTRPSGAPPEWVDALDKAERPPFLPKGIEYGKEPGEYVNARDGSVLVFVPKGKFMMGAESPPRDHLQDGPRHEVELDAFFIGKYETRNKEFARFVADTHHVTTAEAQFQGCVVISNRSPTGDDGELVDGLHWRKPGPHVAPTARDDDPVVQVSWTDATEYCKWAGLALPSEAQWERAAAWDRKEHRSRRYAWGDETPSAALKKVANLPDERLAALFPGCDIFATYDDGFGGIAPVGQFKDGASPSGALDMSGNVAEWCDDDYDAQAYDHLDKKNPVGRSNPQQHVARGGSFARSPNAVLVTWRANHATNRRIEDLGFRVCKPAP